MPAKTTKPKTKPAHAVATRVGARVRSKDALAQMLFERGQDKREELATLLRLRGEELGRLHERVTRIETNLARRATSQDSSSEQTRTAIRSLDATLAQLGERVDGIEDRLAVIEAALFDIAAAHLAKHGGREPATDALEQQWTSERDAADVSPEIATVTSDPPTEPAPAATTSPEGDPPALRDNSVDTPDNA